MFYFEVFPFGLCLDRGLVFDLVYFEVFPFCLCLNRGLGFDLVYFSSASIVLFSFAPDTVAVRTVGVPIQRRPH